MELSTALRNDTKIMILSNFEEFMAPLQNMHTQAFLIKVEHEDQITQMEAAKQLRLRMQKIRTSADKKKTELKADALEYGRAVQSVYNHIEKLCREAEGHLKEQENFLKIREEQRKTALQQERYTIMMGTSPTLGIYEGLGDMSEDTFQFILDGVKARVQAEKEAKARKEEEMRQAILRAEEEIKRKREEDARVRAELAAAQAERIRLEEIRREEQTEAKKRMDALIAEAERNRQEAERARKEAVEMQRRAEESKAPKYTTETVPTGTAPDATRLREFLDHIHRIPQPTLQSKVAKEIMNEILTLLNRIEKHVEKRIASSSL